MRLTQKQLVEVYAVVIEALQKRAPKFGVVFHSGHTEARVRLSPDASTIQNVLQNLKGILVGDIPALRSNEHCQIGEFKQQFKTQTVKDGKVTLRRGFSAQEVQH